MTELKQYRYYYGTSLRSGVRATDDGDAIIQIAREIRAEAEMAGYAAKVPLDGRVSIERVDKSAPGTPEIAVAVGTPITVAEFLKTIEDADIIEKVLGR
jgi:hypothetical protein